MILRHRDKEVLRFDWVGPQSVRVVSVNEAARQFLPLGRLRALEDFLQRRIDAIENGRGVQGKSCTIKNKNKVQVAEKKSAQFEEMIKVNLQADPFITAEELSRLLGVAPRTIFTRLKNLQVAGVVRRIGSRKTGHWEVVASSAADLKEEHENG
jgi:hypothetical protein